MIKGDASASPVFVMKGGDPMLKRYIVNGMEFQYEEGEQPAGAVEVKPEKKAAEPLNKAVKPANNKRTVKRK